MNNSHPPLQWPGGVDSYRIKPPSHERLLVVVTYCKAAILLPAYSNGVIAYVGGQCQPDIAEREATTIAARQEANRRN